jgi:hypothetical protein
MSFETILLRIAGGESVPSSELVPYLCLERREQRAEVNTLLAKACWESGIAPHRQQAKLFISRAWLLSGFSPKVLPLYTEIYSALDDIAGIREAYKRVGINFASKGEVSEALEYFDRWQYAYMQSIRLDKYDYDFDILGWVEKLAEPYRFATRLRSDALSGGPMRVAYLIKGITDRGSSLARINLYFAQYHDHARVEPMFFVPEAEYTVNATPCGLEHLQLFTRLGCKVTMAPNFRRLQDRLLAIATMIYDSRPDILVLSAALAEFQHYFIASMRPAPVVIGLIQGPPQQFAPPNLDWSIAWSRHPLIDSPVSSSLVDMQFELPRRSEITPLKKLDLDIPDDALIIGTGGRHVKFQDPQFWQAIIELLDAYPQLYYLALGVEESQIPFLPGLVSPETKSRIRFISWRGADYLKALCLADIVIDTFPSGGGSVLCDAMALGIPIVSFKNDYLKRYDQTDWTPAEEFVIPEAIVARGDFDAMKRLVSKLIEDPNHRAELGQRCQVHVSQLLSDPAQPVRKCEDIFVRVLEEKLSGIPSLDAREVEVAELVRRLSPRVLPGWVAWPLRQLKRAFRFGERVLDRVA